ncbi:MAG: glycoside hydrolase family 127 protein, partial [Blastocatellia bacterium]
MIRRRAGCFNSSRIRKSRRCRRAKKLGDADIETPRRWIVAGAPVDGVAPLAPEPVKSEAAALSVRPFTATEGNIRAASFDLNGLWSPWDTLHKTYAGLRDAYRYTGNRTALDLEIKFAAWCESVMSKLDNAQTQKMLNTEFGGMPEVLADLYAGTGDKRWLALSHRFDHRAVHDPLARGQDILGGLHGNTQAPRLHGSLARYAYTGDKMDGDAARFFWDAVVLHHSFATGGHGKDEYFGPPDQMSDRIDGRTAETCNIYNMLRMTRKMFALHPDMKYVEFHERALFNHILGSQDSEDGRTCYMVPVGRGLQREYADMQRSFTCCAGAGMESHALHGDGLYYESGDKLWVNIYAPSTAKWGDVDLAMETTFPEGDAARLKLTMKAAQQFTLALRRPSWADEGFAVKVNGQAVRQLSAPGTYIERKRKWKSGDTVTLALVKTLRLEPLPDNPGITAIMWGPIVLAGDLGPERERRRGTSGQAGAQQPVAQMIKIPSLVAAERTPAAWIKAIADKPGAFRTAGAGRDSDVDLVPFYRLHRRTYSVYFDLFTPAEWEKKAATLLAEQERQRQLEAATIAYVEAGEVYFERDFNQQGEETQPLRNQGRPGRSARKWFSYDIPI